MKRLTLVSCVWMLTVLGAAGARAQTGVSLAIQPGARQNGMGAAGVALIGDGSQAAWWNPAALGFAGTLSAQWTHARLLPDLADLPYNFYSVAAGFRGRGGIAVSGTNLSYGSDLDYERSVAFSAGAQPLPGFALGATIKHVRVHVGSFGLSGETNGYDFAVLDRIRSSSRSALSFGANLQNTVGKITLVNEDPLPRKLRVGAAWDLRLRIRSEHVTMGTVVVTDYNQTLDDSQGRYHTWNGGVEAWVNVSQTIIFALRGGYYDDPRGEIQDITYGAGIRAAGLAVDVGRIPEAKNSDLPYVTKVTSSFALDGLLSFLRGSRRSEPS